METQRLDQCGPWTERNAATQPTHALSYRLYFGPAKHAYVEVGISEYSTGGRGAYAFMKGSKGWSVDLPVQEVLSPEQLRALVQEFLEVDPLAKHLGIHGDDGNSLI